MQEAFQLYIKAVDEDDSEDHVDDDIDDIYINMELRADSKLPSRTSTHVGVLGFVTVKLSIRVQCLEDFYGDDCSTFCTLQDSDQNGHFACNSEDGSRLCLQGFQNPDNNCRDAITGDGIYYS